MEQLLNIDGVASQHDVKGLRQLYDVIESNVRSFKSLGVKADFYGSLLSSVVMTRLPSELRLIISRKFGDSDSWIFDELLRLIEEEVQACERSSTRSSQTECDTRIFQPQLLCSLIPSRLIVVFVNRITLRRTVKQPLVLSDSVVALASSFLG